MCETPFDRISRALDGWRLERPLRFLFLCALVQLVAYAIAGYSVREDWSIAVVQGDSMMYLQAARRIAEGHPFSFCTGTAVSTGTTSVLYPFVLAPFYCLGFTGASFYNVDFVVNAACYLAFLWGWGVVILRRFSGRGAAVALLLLALFPHPAYNAVAMTDTGLWMAVSAGLAAGFVTGRFALYAPLLLVAPWVRPEGMVLALAFAVFAFGSRAPRRDRGLAVAAVISMAGVFALNYALTGAAQFSSVANKGYSKRQPHGEALNSLLLDGWRILRELLLGLPAKFPRTHFFPPLVAAAAAWVAVFTYDWRRLSWREWAFVAAGLGAALTVADSGWQDTNLDRYFAWSLPVYQLLVAGGTVWFCRQLARPWRWLPAAAMVLLYGLLSASHWAMFHVNGKVGDLDRQFEAHLNRVLEPEASVGFIGGCGGAYELGSRHIANLSGIYSPEFPNCDFQAALETLKREPATRVTHLVVRSSRDTDVLPAEQLDLISLGSLPGPNGLSAHQVGWKIFDNGAQDVINPPVGKRLVQRIDIGYLPEERAADYECHSGYSMAPPIKVSSIKGLNGRYAFEVGRPVLGHDLMTLKVEPHKDAVVVMRTARSAPAVSYVCGVKVGGERDFGTNLMVTAAIDGKYIGDFTGVIDAENFTELELAIPGEALTSEACRLYLVGPHLAYGYWVYQ